MGVGGGGSKAETVPGASNDAASTRAAADQPGRKGFILRCPKGLPTQSSGTMRVYFKNGRPGKPCAARAEFPIRGLSFHGKPSGLSNQADCKDFSVVGCHGRVGRSLTHGRHGRGTRPKGGWVG